MSVLSLSVFEDQSPRDLVRWSAAAAIVVSVHAGAAAFLLNWHEPTDVGNDAEVVSVELAPIDSTPDAVARDAAPAPETMVESKEVPQPQQDKPRQKLTVERPPDDVPALIPLPVVKPPEQVEEARPPAPRTAERVKGGAPHIEPSWQTILVRALQRAKRYPPEAQSRNEQGVVLLSFSLDRSGRVLARSIAKSSGYAELDNEVMAMIVRAGPLPPFPASMPEQRLDLTVPIRFSLK
ncbi:MAG TPA: energy transducer TonB [Xanthobacteraceae bacterium]|nr:energy transducer TonB [Xanthobacteraceae bacterium]